MAYSRVNPAISQVFCTLKHNHVSSKLIWLGRARQAELNKNKAKPPYKELSGKGSVAEQAEEAWAYTRACNSSVIDDIFGGQLQSTIQCSSCQACSHCFEYFLDLSLPIPKQRSSVTVQVAFQTLWHLAPGSSRPTSAFK